MCLLISAILLLGLLNGLMTLHVSNFSTVKYSILNNSVTIIYVTYPEVLLYFYRGA